MPPLVWDTIMSVKPTDLQPEELDNLYDMLKDGDATSEDDPLKLKKLFNITKEVMIIKHQDSEEAMTEAEKEAEKAEKKENDLKGKITKLNKELDELRKYGPGDGGAGGATARDTRYLRDQIRDLEEQNQQLHDESRDLQRDLSNEKRAAEKYSEKINELEEELSRLRKDNDQYRQDISDYMMQLQAQRENLVARRGDDQDIRDKMAKKNRELGDAMEELQNLTDNNELLQKRCAELESNLAEANDQMFKAAEDYQKIKIVLQQSDDVTDKLRQDNEVLKAQRDDLIEQVQLKKESDDAIMVAVNNKIEEFKSKSSDQENQIKEWRDQVFKLREQLIAANMDTDKASVSALSQAIKDKDKQIEEMTEKISQYVLDMESNATLIDELRSELHKGGKGQTDRFTTKLRDLEKEVKEKRDNMKNYENDAKKAEEDARLKDQELSELLERMRQYEAGEYGLQEAVAEIKEHKTQIKVRDRQIEELTKHINQAELKINDILDENEELRYKLGMDPKEELDLTEFRKNKAVRKEEEKALNFILQREIERLEDERLDLKKKIRKLAQQTGQRAVALGLTAEDMIAVQDFTEDLKQRKQGQNETESFATVIRREVAQEEKIIRSRELKVDYQRNLKDLDEYQQDNAELRAKTNQLQLENQRLQDSVKEVLVVLKEKVSDGKIDPASVQLPALDKMLAALEAKKVIGGHDTSSYMKEQFDVMRGRNEELRNELRESRVESTKTALERDKAFTQIEKLEKDQVTLQGTNVGGLYQALPLPEGMAITSTEIIASLNEHLVVTLQENHLRGEIVKKMESALEDYKRKFGVMRHQQGLIYQDYLKDKKEWEEDVKKLQEQMKKVEGLREEDQVKIQEFDRLIETLGKDDVEVRRRLSEMTRKITVLRVNEKALTRRHTIMEEVESSLRKNIQNMTNEMAEMETAVAERMGYLQRYKDVASFKISALQKALDDSVPSSDLDKVNKQYHELTEKYRDMLENGNSLVNKAEAVIGLENEVKRLTETNEEIKKTMSIEKEKLHALEAAMEELNRRGMTDGSEVKVTDSDIISISKKITMLEMKELNERQRAEHAVRMYEQQKTILHDLETRNKTLEDKFADTTKMNLEMQKTERDLRDELANCVLKSVSDADRKRINELEETVVQLQQEISKLKEVAEVAGSQVKTLKMQNISREKETKSLRQQLVDFQMQSDEKTIIGKLHRQIVQLQVSEGTAVRKWEEAKKKITKREAHVLRLEQKIDEKDKSIYHNRTEAQNKAKYLKRSLQDLRIQFAGAVPLSKQEKFSKLMTNLVNDKSKLEVQLRDVNKQREEVEDEIAALKLQHESLQELISTLKDGHGAAKVKEWHGKMDVIRLEELKLKRLNTKLNGQIRYLEEIIRSHEVTITDLEAENVRLMKDYEERQLVWEQREVELERNISQLERNASQIAGAASQFEEALGNLPDAKLPVANQLEQAISTIRNNVKIILDTQAESKVLKQRVTELEKLLHNAEHTVIQRDKLISELRLRMPATADRDDIILKATATSTQAAIQSQAKTADFEETQAIKIAQSTISSLNQRIQQKEETIAKYQELLGQARNDMQEMNRRHEAELKAMQERIHLKTDDAFSKFKEAAQELMNKQFTSRGITDKQLARLHELEDIVAESDNAVAAMSEKLRQREEENIQLKNKLQITEKHHITEKERVFAVHKEEDEKKNIENDEHKRTNIELRKEIEILNEEINTLKDSNNRAPTTTMKNLVERLKNQLALKEKQHQALSKALTELRADMVAQAQETVKSNMEDAGQEKNIQRLIDQQTKQLYEQIEDLQSQVDKQRKELKKRKETISTMTTDLEDLKEDLAQKERSVNKLKSDKQRLEQEVDELEKKVERMNTMRHQKTGEFERQQELDEARRRLRLLEDELKKKQQFAEKPYEKEEKKVDDLVKWEESKKWQRTVDKMKGKLKDREAEVEKLNKTIEMMKANMDRVSREKESIESRSRAFSKTNVSSLGTAPPSKKQHDIEELKHKNYELQEEINKLKRQKILGEDSSNMDIKLRNQQLQEQVEQLKRALDSEDGTVSAFEYQKLFEKNQQLQKDMLKLSEENIELKFELEQTRKDIPRQKERVTDLQKYVEALKYENSQLGGASSARSGTSSVSSIRRIGESGKSTRELEKTIALLKKVVEKTQADNEQLKRSANGSGSEQVAFLKLENDGLKNQLEELKHEMGAALNERYTSQQKGTAKMMTDYDKLRKELVKEKEINEKLRIELRTQEMVKEQQFKLLESTKSKLEIEEAKRPSNNSDNKGWKSAVVTRMYEDQINTLESDIDKKNKQLADNKKLLKEAAEREQNLLEEKSQLLHQISILERLPPGSQVKDIDIMKEFQQARVKIDKLEIEKKELLQEIRMYRKGGSNTDILDDDIVTKAAKYDRILEENVEVRMNMKTIALERDKYKSEMTKLKKELDNFGPEFFEEIEDLKYNYKQAVQKNVLYEEKLLNVSKQFGIHLNIPGLE